MSAPQKIASHVRKVSQLSSALGVSHVQNLNPSLQNCGQSYQILHTAVLQQNVEVIGQNKKDFEARETKDGRTMKQLGAEWSCLPLPAKRWEQEEKMSGVTLSVLEERRRT
eukprot:TRINITY_DN8970_c0_g1_i1.p1 TRINITY_DN8970_c0_g1~~TRINITY_DN8970_c0_g1_i1.p1  ORF type:complete len:111 (+),score=35.75 TRINITY_DN8970_c0_g1_i1:93-425(+)